MNKTEQQEWAEEIANLKALRVAKEGVMDAVETYVMCQNKTRDIAFKKLMQFKLNYTPRHFFKSDYYTKGDEDSPFFTEAYLYNLLGKEDARTVLAYLGTVLRASGYRSGTSDIKLDEEKT